MLNQEIRDAYQAVIGLEVHAQLLTRSKLFSADPVAYGSPPNTCTSPITLAHPGTLPRLNKQAVTFALRMGLACGCEISRYNLFDRKNYFYPDLPKGYQITQDKTPLCKGGQLQITTGEGRRTIIALNRIHLEEDAGKSQHLAGEADTLVDFNRAGTPLIEIVTEPVMHTAEEAAAFLQEIRRLVRYLEICDGNMEEGSLRCDVNISLRPSVSRIQGKKVEVKNLNSFSHVKRAIAWEIGRQTALLEKGEPIPSETRTFDAHTGTTRAMRTKEEINDYRYFPEPDLGPLLISDAWLEEVQDQMPPLPWELYEQFVRDFGLSEYDAQLLTENKPLALYFVSLCQHVTSAKAAANWMLGPVKSTLNQRSWEIQQFPLAPEQLAALILLVEDGKLSFTVAAQRLYPLLLQQPQQNALALAEAENMLQERSQEALLPLVQEVLAAHPEKVAAYRSGKSALLSMFMGEIMKKSRGKADPKVASELLQRYLTQ